MKPEDSTSSPETLLQPSPLTQGKFLVIVRLVMQISIADSFLYSCLCYERSVFVNIYVEMENGTFVGSCP